MTPSPQAPECQCCHGPVVRRVANFCPEKARADDSVYCNNIEIGGALGGQPWRRNHDTGILKSCELLSFNSPHEKVQALCFGEGVIAG